MTEPKFMSGARLKAIRERAEEEPRGPWGTIAQEAIEELLAHIDAQAEELKSLRGERDEARFERCAIAVLASVMTLDKITEERYAKSRGWGYLYTDGECGLFPCYDSEANAPGLTDEQARDLAKRWATHADGNRLAFVDSVPAPLTDAEREALYAWVRSRADERRPVPGVALELGSADTVRVVALHVGTDLGIDHAEELLRAAGWPS